MAETKREIYLRAIEEALGLALPAPKEGDPAAQVTEAMRYSLLCGGKRVRPSLTLAFCELCGEGHCPLPAPLRCCTPILSSTTTCPAWTTTICEGGGPPAIGYMAKPWPYWPGTGP